MFRRTSVHRSHIRVQMLSEYRAELGLKNLILDLVA